MLFYYTIVLGNTPSSVGLNQNHIIVFIKIFESNTKTQVWTLNFNISIFQYGVKDPTINNLFTYTYFEYALKAPFYKSERKLDNGLYDLFR